MMIAHKGFDPNPENTPENVKELVQARFHSDSDEAMPELLSEFCTLLGHEDEKWGGVAAMKVCIKEFKKGRQDSNYHQRDLETFLFSSNRYIPIVIPVADRPSTSQTGIPGPVRQTSVPPANPKTLKGKIYMGSGWKKDFPILLDRRHPPSLWVNINLQEDKSQENDKTQQSDKSQKNDKSQKIDKSQKNDKSHKTKVQKKTWTPCWGEKFEFSLSSPEVSKLNLEVYDSSRKEFAGKTCVSVSGLEPGIRVIPLSEPYSSTWLLMRFLL